MCVAMGLWLITWRQVVMGAMHMCTACILGSKSYIVRDAERLGYNASHMPQEVVGCFNKPMSTILHD